MIRLSKSSWLPWIFITSIGSTTGFTLGRSLGRFFNDYSFPLFLLVVVAIASLLIGLGQWMILRTKLAGNAWGWVPATAIGLPLGLFIGFWVSRLLLGPLFFNEWIQLFLMASIAGMFTGMLQWLALHRKLVNSLRWILTSTVGWGVGFTATDVLFYTYLSKLEFGSLFMSILGMSIGTLVGMISGAFVEPMLIQTEHQGTESLPQAS